MVTWFHTANWVELEWKSRPFSHALCAYRPCQLDMPPGGATSCFFFFLVEQFTTLSSVSGFCYHFRQTDLVAGCEKCLQTFHCTCSALFTLSLSLPLLLSSDSDSCTSFTPTLRLHGNSCSSFCSLFSFYLFPNFSWLMALDSSPELPPTPFQTLFRRRKNLHSLFIRQQLYYAPQFALNYWRTRELVP